MIFQKQNNGTRTNFDRNLNAQKPRKIEIFDIYSKTFLLKHFNECKMIIKNRNH